LKVFLLDSPEPGFFLTIGIPDKNILLLNAAVSSSLAARLQLSLILDDGCAEDSKYDIIQYCLGPLNVALG
jgi:hypothetical protein